MVIAPIAIGSELAGPRPPISFVIDNELEGRADTITFGLTRRETQVAALVTAGYTNRDVAAQLSISVNTVKHHLSSIFDKMGVSTRLEVALFALHHRLL